MIFLVLNGLCAALLLYFDRYAQIDVRRFKEALDLMHHRGPDNQSIFTFKKPKHITSIVR